MCLIGQLLLIEAGKPKPMTARERFVPYVNSVTEFINSFHKHYSSPSDTALRISHIVARKWSFFKSQIFYKNGDKSWYQEGNEFMDRTLDEIKSMLGVRRLEDDERLLNDALQVKRSHLTDSHGLGESSSFESLLDRPSMALEGYQETRSEGSPLEELVREFEQNETRDITLPDQIFIDHNNSGCLDLPKDQGNCGSCYIFASIALFEWLHCKQTGERVRFSEQYMIDCGSRTGLKGCRGGYKLNALKFVHYFGLELASNYPYRANTDQCPYGFASDNPLTKDSRMGFIRPKLSSVKVIEHTNLEQALKDGPVIVDIMVRPDFVFFGGGVDEGKGCRDENRSAHTMLLVGHGREDGLEYWLLRNSFGPNWARTGHYKLDKRADCWINTAGQQIFGTFSSNARYDGAPIKKA